MKVLILMPMATQRGGGELMLWQLLEHADSSMVEWVVVFFEKGPLVAEVEELGVTTYVVETGRLRQLHRFVRAVASIRDLIHKEDPDLVFSWSGKPHLYAAPAAAGTGVPTAWYQLGCPQGRHLSWMDRLVTLLPTSCVFVLSQFGEEGQQHLWPSRPTRLVYPSADRDRFDPTSMPSPRTTRAQLDLPLDGPLIGIVGRLQHWKGIHVFVEAMAQVHESHPEAYGVVVGGKHDLEPDYPEVVQRLIEKHRLEDRILTVGYQKDIPHWMQAMDIIVHASDHEPFGIVIIEALALGKPVIAGAEGGPAEIISHGHDGLLVPFGDAGQLADAIRHLLDDSVHADRIAEKGQLRAADFSHSRYATSFVSQIRALLQGNHQTK